MRKLISHLVAGAITAGLVWVPTGNMHVFKSLTGDTLISVSAEPSKSTPQLNDTRQLGRLAARLDLERSKFFGEMRGDMSAMRSTSDVDIDVSTSRTGDTLISAH